MISVKKVLNFKELKEIFIVSNTPNYLYRQFRRDSSIQNLSSLLTTEQLIHRFKHAVKRNLNKVDVIVYIYSIIVALTYKDHKEVRDFITRLTTYNIAWFKNIAGIYMASAKMTTVTRSKHKPQFEILSKSI